MTERRCPRCDCPDNAGQCEHCKVCPHAAGSDDFIREACPHCDEAPPRNRVDEHVRSAHADLPRCTARIDNEHGLYTCAFRASHKGGEYGKWHASASGGPAGRTVWNDRARGAIPHQPAPIAKAQPQADPSEFVIALHEDDGTLIVGIRPDGQITTGPSYQPDAAAREFWDAVTRAAQATSPWPDAISKENEA